MACGVFHKASKGLWTSTKKFLGRAASGIKKGAQWLWNNKDKVFDVAGKVSNAIGNEKLTNIVNKTQEYTNKGLNIANGLGFVS